LLLCNFRGNACTRSPIAQLFIDTPWGREPAGEEKMERDNRSWRSADKSAAPAFVRFWINADFRTLRRTLSVRLEVYGVYYCTTCCEFGASRGGHGGLILSFAT
jgi:hypothetical protein